MIAGAEHKATMRDVSKKCYQQHGWLCMTRKVTSEYIDIDIHIHTQKHIHTHICAETETYMCTYTYVCMHACTHISMYASMHVCIYACMHVCIYGCMHVCIYACMHIRIHMYRDYSAAQGFQRPAACQSYLGRPQVVQHGAAAARQRAEPCMEAAPGQTPRLWRLLQRSVRS